MENNQSTIPFFSVIITTYNRAAILRRALESLLRQVEKDWEAIIIDDGSTDDTQKILKEYTEKYPNIRAYFYQNAGPNIAKNRGIQKSKGQFITFLDSDDEYESTHLSSRKEILQSKSQLQFLHGGIKIIGDEYVPDMFYPNQKIHISECAVGGTFFIRQDVVETLGLFADIPMGSDAQFLERVKQSDYNIAKTDLPTYIYHREHESSVTKDF
ncbi:MAG: glycosyltransferase family 2 protein [Chitinophagales bacterium]|nr:glycosyltransferase family 2 protein [Chitinophagales bacterium]